MGIKVTYKRIAFFWVAFGIGYTIWTAVWYEINRPSIYQEGFEYSEYVEKRMHESRRNAEMAMTIILTLIGVGFIIGINMRQARHKKESDDLLDDTV